MNVELLINTGQITVIHWIQKTSEQPTGLIRLKSVAEGKGKGKV